MKILLSWIDLDTDMLKGKKEGEYSGPTLETVQQNEYDNLHLFASSESTKRIRSIP